MKAVRWPASILAGVLFGVGSLRAEGLAGRFSISVQAGTQVELAGDAIGPAQGALLGQPTILESRTYGDLYRPGLRLAALASYGVAQHLELTLRGSFYAPRAAVLEVGSFDDGPLLFCIEQVDGTGTACEEKRLPEYGLELGLRYTIAPQGRLKSYMAVAAGVRHTPEQLVSLQAPESAAAVLHLPFDDAWIIVDLEHPVSALVSAAS